MNKCIVKFTILFFALVADYSNVTAIENDKPYVIGELLGQLGNNLFQVATASALAWDNNAEAYFPKLVTIPTLYHHIFFQCKCTPPADTINFEWVEPAFDYHPIPYQPNMKISGYFQSYKYFSHYRERLIKLFSPCQKDLNYIKKKYQWIIDHPETVGIQIRYYKNEDPNEECYKQCGAVYLSKAMSYFPESSLFIVSTNNLEFAKKCIPSWAKNVYFFENEKFYIEFFILTFCKHNIISNSTFGWWSGWLNQNPEKIVIRPKNWINSFPTQDVCPSEWIEIDN